MHYEILDKKCQEKMPSLDPVLAIKSLAYFEDVSEEKIRFVPGREVEFEAVKRFLTKQAKNFF